MTAVNKADECPCSSQEESLQRWQKHFEAALNHLSGRPSAAVDAESAQANVDPKTATNEPTLAEVTRAILKLKNIRAAEPNGNPPKLRKCAINPLSRSLRSLVIQKLSSSTQLLKPSRAWTVSRRQLPNLTSYDLRVSWPKTKPQNLGAGTQHSTSRRDSRKHSR